MIPVCDAHTVVGPRLALQWRGEGGARRRPFLAATDASSSRRVGKKNEEWREGGKVGMRQGGNGARWGRGKERKNTSRMPCVRVCKGAVRGSPSYINFSCFWCVKLDLKHSKGKEEKSETHSLPCGHLFILHARPPSREGPSLYTPPSTAYSSRERTIKSITHPRQWTQWLCL